jgi:hypothetical protein
MKAAGRYRELVAEDLHNAEIFVSNVVPCFTAQLLVNPKLIKDFGSNSLRKVKTDKADARKIARYGLENWSKLREYTSEDSTRVKLKEFSRQYDLYDKIKKAARMCFRILHRNFAWMNFASHFRVNQAKMLQFTQNSVKRKLF